jgi:hypothetical protein
MSSTKKYKIKQYSLDKIQELNTKLDTDIFSIKLSKNPSKKLDIYERDKVIASIGAIKKNGVPFMDYGTYLEEMGEKYANKRRKLYLARHAKEKDIIDDTVSTSWWTRWILW